MAAASASCVATAGSVITIRHGRRARIGPTSMPARESAMSAASRRSRVSARFALVTQWVTVRRYDGERACQSAQAPASAWKRAVSSSVRTVSAFS